MSAISIPSLYRPPKGLWTPQSRPARRSLASRFTEFFSTAGKGKSTNGKGVESPVGKGREDSATNEKCCCNTCPREYEVLPITAAEVIAGGRIRITCPGHGIDRALPRVNWPASQYITFIPCGVPFIFGSSLERINSFVSAGAVVDANTFTCAHNTTPAPPLGAIAPPYGFLDRSVSGHIGTWPERGLRGHPWWYRLSFEGITLNPYHVYPTYEEPPYCGDELAISGEIPEVTDLEVEFTESYHYYFTGSSERYDYDRVTWQKIFMGPTCNRIGYSSNQWIARLRIGVDRYESWYYSPNTIRTTYYKEATLTNYAIGNVADCIISYVAIESPPPTTPHPALDDPEWAIEASGAGPRYEGRTADNFYTSPDSGDPCYPNAGYGGSATWKPCKADFQTRPNEMGW